MAGRPKGMPKTGGRRKGTPNKSTHEILETIEKTGVTPLQFLIDQMRDDKNPLDLRIHCAAKAAPFIHRKMPAAVEASIDGESVFQVVLQKGDENL